MYDRLGEIENQHINAYKMNPHGVTLHPKDIDWLIEQAKKVEWNKMADAFIAIRDYDWELVKAGNKKILVPPLTDKRRMWTTIWDENGLPHWLPKFSESEK